jgi:predicted phage terminase large subunit-like protein
MGFKGLAREIQARIDSGTVEYQLYNDYFDIVSSYLSDERGYAVDWIRWLSGRIIKAIDDVIKSGDVETGNKLMELHKRVLLSIARWDFDSFLLYVEWNREPSKQFYYPRRGVLKQVVDEMQRLEDDELDLLSISLPPGVGKSTLAIFYLTWLAGKYPEETCLTGSHSNSWVRGAYDECLRIMDRNGEYLWHDVFPGVEVTSTNAKDCRIDLGNRKRFETLEFTSIGTGNAGLYRAMRLLYCDDLVSGSEVALSKERLDKLWGVYTTDLRQRKLGAKCKELHIATRWSVHDVLGRLESEYGESERAKFIRIPAMDEKDESNFDYPYGVGYSTKTLREQREVMDDTDWRALFMNEPIEREGLLYSRDELRRYFELPEGEPDAILAVCDTKDRGGDYFCMPVAYQYGPDFYIDGVICDNGNPDVVEPRLVNILVEREVHMARFESNQAGGRIASSVQEKVKERGGRCKITTKYTTSNKETKIIVNSPWVLKNCLFKDDSVIKNDKEYRRFLQFLCGYTMAGKNKYDDVPDAMAQLAEYIQNFAMNKVEIVKRLF